MKSTLKILIPVLLLVLLLLLGPRLASELIWHRSLDAGMFELQLRMAGRDDMKGDPEAWFAAKAEKNAGPLLFPEDMQYPPSAYTKGGMDYYVLNPQEHSELLIVYFAGGTYIDRPQAEHFAFADELAAATGAEIRLPDYPKLPEHTAGTAYPILLDFCREVLAQESYDRLVFMGDSAGGGLALSLANQLARSEEALPVPEELILLSPWLDLSMTNSALSDYERKEPKLDRETLAAAGQVWAGSLDVKDGTVSPLYADNFWLRGDSDRQLSLFAGTRELLYPDIVRYSERLTEEGLDHRLILGQGMNHIWPLYRAYGVAEAEEAFDLILQELKN